MLYIVIKFEFQLVIIEICSNKRKFHFSPPMSQNFIPHALYLASNVILPFFKSKLIEI